MYNFTIHSKIALLDQVMDDLKEINSEIQATNDPALLSELKEEKKELVVELNEVGFECIRILETYMIECKEEGIPVALDYYRVLRELKRSEVR